MATVVISKEVSNKLRNVTVEELVRRNIIPRRLGAYKDSRPDFPNPVFRGIFKKNGKVYAEYRVWFYQMHPEGWEFEHVEVEFDPNTGDLLEDYSLTYTSLRKR